MPARTPILTVICIAVIAISSSAQCGLVDRNSPEAVKSEVNRIYNETLDAMSYRLPNGVTAITWIPPNDSVRGQIECLGTLAVPQLSELLQHSDRSFGRLLSIVMLGWIGGPEIVPPLTWALSRQGDFLLTKTAALESLTAAPPDKAVIVIQDVLRRETNPHLLDKAKSVLARISSSTAK